MRVGREPLLRRGNADLRQRVAGAGACFRAGDIGVMRADRLGHLRPDAQTSLTQAAQFLQQHANLRFTVEGHCDERGSTEYNLALGDKRAAAVKEALVKGGVNGSRVNTISYGKEKPFCTESNEQCWQQNRRGHFVLQK